MNTTPTDDQTFTEFLHDEWDDAPTAARIAIVIATTAVGTGIVALLIWIVGLLGDLIGWIADKGTDGPRALAGWKLTRVITDPVQHYLTTHTAGLPVRAELLYGAWLTALVVLLVLSTVGSWGARIGWTILGAGSAWMVWSGTPTGSKGLALGVAVTAWALLSVLALRGAWHGGRVTNIYVTNKLADTDD